MQRRALWLLSLLPVAALSASGCNDLGTCDDPARGRSTVRVGSDIVYAGQAIMSASCANGCHSSRATGEARRGAPAGLDFDLNLIAPGAVVTGDQGGVVGVQVDAAEVAGLRARQRKVFDERELIWEQIDKGLMPPEDSFKLLQNVYEFVFGSGGSCPSQAELTSLQNLDSAKEQLRSWLACGTPIVETNSPLLPWALPAAEGGAPESAAGAAAYAGSAGYQYPACGGGGGDGGAGPTFEQVYTDVFSKAANGCLGCHSGAAAMGAFDLGTSADTAYAKLLGAGQGGMTTCASNPAPFVTPGDPAASYLIAKLGGGGVICGAPMPPFDAVGLNAADLEIVRQWITAGAMR